MHLFTSVLFFSLVYVSRNERLTDDKALNFISFEFVAEEAQDHTFLTLKMRDRGITEQQIENFEWASKIYGWRKVQRGRYLFDGDYSFFEVLDKLGRGIQDPVNIVVLPGIDIETFSESVASKLNFSAKSLQSALTDSSLLDDLGIESVMLFPRMFPDTYTMYWTTTPEQVIRRINDSFEKRVIEPHQARLSERRYNLKNVLTMASIVEWEAKNDEEKKKISGLYWNRIKKGWRLQADPTVNYAVGQRRRLTFDDYKFEHPYNTYLKRGFPPGPINNPSLSSIEAALYPDDHDFMYMVASPEGTHVFTRTYEEHTKASEEWRRWLRRQYRIKRQKEAENASR